SHFVYRGERGINQLLPSDWLHSYLWHISTLTKPTSALSQRANFTAVSPVIQVIMGTIKLFFD
ncbi:hypothetical protein KHA85_16790, partial [Dietzia sp. Marseille-Q0999]|nr:hypothetical protein [Dietzia massiliensis]